MKHDRKDTRLSVKKSANKVLKRQLKDAKGHIEALKAEISASHSEMGVLEYRCNLLVLRIRELERQNHELDMELDKYSIRVEPMNGSKVKVSHLIPLFTRLILNKLTVVGTLSYCWKIPKGICYLSIVRVCLKPFGSRIEDHHQRSCFERIVSFLEPISRTPMFNTIQIKS